MVTHLEIIHFSEFSANPVPSPLYRALHEVSRPNGCAVRAFGGFQRL